MSDTKEKVYYVYQTDDNRHFYFYETETKKTTYEMPKDGILLDPETGEDYIFPEHEGEDEDENPTIELDVSQEVKDFDENKISKKEPFSDRKTSFIPAADGGPAYLPNDLQEDIKKFSIPEFAKKFFRAHRGNHKFQRKKVKLEALIEFSSEPLTEPLLEEIDQKNAKHAIKAFKYILIYTEVINHKNPASYADKIMKILQNSPPLRDEIMFQLVKQTRNNPNPLWLKKTWELFVIVVTVFPSTRNSEVYIKSHMASESKSSNEEVAQLASFAYIRFSARCAIGKEMDTSQEIGLYQKIPAQVNMGRKIFGASIYEQIWNQRRSMKRLPIPFILHHMADNLFRKNANQVEGIFRLPGNLKKIDEIADELNQGRDSLSSASVHDLASLMKKWFRDLPDPVVNLGKVELLENAFEDPEKPYIDFANSLPNSHRLTLMYLIGFLQKLCKSQDVTKMTSKNFAIVFGPNIIQIRDSNEPSKIKKFSDIAIEFVSTLIESWDTSQIYPLNMEYLQ